MRFLFLPIIGYILLSYFVDAKAGSDTKIIDVINDKYDCGYIVPLNLSAYYTVGVCEITDTMTSNDLKKRLIKYTKKCCSGLDKIEDLKWDIYIIEDHENLVFFYSGGTDLIYPHRYNIAYNRALNKFFELRTMINQDINEFLQTEKFPMFKESLIIKYCFLLVKLKNSPKVIRIIGDAADIFIDASIKYPTSMELGDYKFYKNLEISYPQIIQTGDLIETTFYIAVKDYLKREFNISKVYIKLEGQELKDYTQEKIVELPAW